MKTNKKFLKNMRSYTAKVMNCKDFFDYITVMFANYWGAHQEARTETLSFANESVMLREAYTVLNATLLTMEATLAEWFSALYGLATNETTKDVVKKIDGYFCLPNILLFVTNNLKEFIDNAATDMYCPFDDETSYATPEDYFNSPSYEFSMYFLKKIAFESAKKVYGYIENHNTDSGEIINWKNECKSYITSWNNELTKPDKWFNTDNLSDIDLVLGSTKIFMTAKMISLLED